MSNATMHRMYVGGRYGSDGDGESVLISETSGNLIPHFEDIVKHTTSKFLIGGTVTFGTGVWQGEIEPTAIIETLIADDVDVAGERAQFLALALQFQTELRQDAVLLTETRVEHRFVVA